jgi:inner membrane transporter RhtA
MPSNPRILSASFAVGILIVAMVSVQIGAAFAKGMFPLVGPQGASALRLFFGTAMLAFALRPWRARPTPTAWRAIVVYGAALGAMNLMFYLSLSRIPMGVAVAVEFTGPLAVALWGSRRALDLVWIAVAVGGLALLLPIGHGQAPLDPLGVACALAAGGCWALYIIFGQKAGDTQGVQTTALGMSIAAILVIPIGVAHAGAALLNPRAIELGVLVGLLSTAIPYTLEMIALTRLPARTFGILMSLEPALGALAGLVILGQTLTIVQWLAVGAVFVASAGATATTPRHLASFTPE